MNAIPALSLDSLLKGATRFSESEKFLASFFAATHDPNLWQEAKNDPGEFLRLRHVKVPERLKVVFTEKPDPRMPTHDHESFKIRFFNCRNYWVRKEDRQGYEQVQVCYGFELVPDPTGPAERR